MVDIKIKCDEEFLPSFETEGSAGMDLKANIEDDIILEPGKRILVGTGVYLELEKGYEGQVRGRSGLAVKHGIGLVNGIGTIDSDYRGEIKVPLINWGEEPFKIIRGDRIAQLVICRYEEVSWKPVSKLSDSQRQTGGFGHTGV